MLVFFKNILNLMKLLKMSPGIIFVFLFPMLSWRKGETVSGLIVYKK